MTRSGVSTSQRRRERERPEQSRAPVQWASGRHPNNSLIYPNRVCDRCILKKIKCDIKHPKCSACIVAGCDCMYSRTRRKPGPVKGSCRRTRQGTGLLSELVSPALCQAVPTSSALPNPQVLGLTGAVPLTDPSMDSQLSMMTPSSHNLDCLALCYLQLATEERRVLVENYIATVNTAFPLFKSCTLLERLEHGTIHSTLSSSICAISAKLMDGYFLYKATDIDAALSGLLSSSKVEIEGVANPAAINQWQTACLLSWYGFNQHPGKGENVRIAVLIRKAYQYGLHQIDSEDNQESFGWNLVSEEALEDWRHVWWCLYLLDCYASFSIAIPHQVETQSLRTALLQDPFVPGPSQSLPGKVFLLPDPANLWGMVQDAAGTRGIKGFGLHMAISSLLKDVVTANRLYKQNPCQSNRERMSVLEDHLSTLQLALPTNYLCCTRSLLEGESNVRYHSRLLNLLKICSMRLILRFPYRALKTSEWETRWLETLEICYLMISLLQNWDLQHLRAVDPAVCFVGLSLLVCLHMHMFSSGVANASLREQLSRRKNIVRLFLQQYATYWALPQLLLDCYETFERGITEQLHSEDVDKIMNQFHGPLQQNWLHYVPLLTRETGLAHFAFTYPELPNVSTVSNAIEQDGPMDIFQGWEDFIPLQRAGW